MLKGNCKETGFQHFEWAELMLAERNHVVEKQASLRNSKKDYSNSINDRYFSSILNQEKAMYLCILQQPLLTEVNDFAFHFE